MTADPTEALLNEAANIAKREAVQQAEKMAAALERDDIKTADMLEAQVVTASKIEAMILALRAPARPEEPARPPDTYHWGETMSQYAVLGIGAEAWVELEDIERRGVAQRNNKRSGMSISWGTFTVLMRVLRAIRLEDFKPAPAARPEGEEKPKPEKREQ